MNVILFEIHVAEIQSILICSMGMSVNVRMDTKVNQKMVKIVLCPLTLLTQRIPSDAMDSANTPKPPKDDVISVI